MRLIEARPEASQRELAHALGVSVGKVNYCLRALMDRGLVKASNFRRSRNKLSYAYLLTPSGIREKTAITARFLDRKIREYEALKAEIAELQREVGK